MFSTPSVMLMLWKSVTLSRPLIAVLTALKRLFGWDFRAHQLSLV